MLQPSGRKNMRNKPQSSGAMERDAVVEMFLNSVEQRKLMYTEYVGDGNTNLFVYTIIKALEKKFGDE